MKEKQYVKRIRENSVIGKETNATKKVCSYRYLGRESR